VIGALRELWSYRELVRELVVRDLKLRYKNSVLGFLWSLLNPLLLMVVFTVVFTVMVPNAAVTDFPVFVLCGLLPWNFFSTSVTTSVNSVVEQSHLIKKVYFPREIVPMSSVLANGVNFGLSLVVLLAAVLISGRPILWVILFLPLIMVVQLLFTLGVAFALSTINVYYRDTSVIMDVVMQAWFFVTPVFYPIDILPEWTTLVGLEIPVRRLVYIINPLASIVANYRSVLYGQVDGGPPGAPGWDFVTRTTLTAVLVCLVGYGFFKRHAVRFAEEL
jgi:lipopolysaccharide transport system permease protein